MTNWEDMVDLIAGRVKQLNALVDQMATRVRELEEMLNAAGVGFEVWVELGDGMSLGYCRWKGRFRVSVSDVGDTHAGAKPWTDCTREIKVSTFARVDDLLERLLSVTTERVKELTAK